MTKRKFNGAGGWNFKEVPDPDFPGATISIKNGMICGCGDTDSVRDRYSFGVYAGKYCDWCWPQSGYRDATDPTQKFDPMDAGEVMDSEDY